MFFNKKGRKQKDVEKRARGFLNDHPQKTVPFQYIVTCVSFLSLFSTPNNLLHFLLCSGKILSLPGSFEIPLILLI